MIDDRRARLQAALVLAGQDDTQASLAALDALIQDARSSDEPSWMSLASRNAAIVAERMGDEGRTIEYLLVAVDARPADPATRFALGSAYARAAKHDLATSSFAECLRLAIESGDDSVLELLRRARPDLIP